MADVIFPNFANALTQGLQARQAVDEMEVRQRRKGLAPDVSAAISGQDPGALGRIAGVDPDYAIKLGPILDKLDADKQAVLKRASDFTIQMGMGVLNSPPEQRPAAYEAAKAEAQRLRIPTESWPASYGPQAEGFLQFNVNKAVPVAKWFEEKEKTARDQIIPGIPGVGGGGPTYQAGGATPQVQAAFVQQMTPHVLQVAQATGQDPRIVMAQAALETGYGTKMVGNNYFGIKGGNGPAVATQEADANGNLVPAQAQFRSYGGPGESAQDYAQLINTDPHYAGLRDVIKKGGDLNAQIDALGKSGYATDPNYAAKVRQIAFGLPTPGAPQAQGPSPAQVAYGRNPVVAQGPGGGAMDLSNTPPAQVNLNTPPPAFQVAQGAPPQIVQGAPGGLGGGIQTAPPPQAPPLSPAQRDPNHPENAGYVPGKQHGMQVEKGGYFLYVNPQNTAQSVWYKPPADRAQFVDERDSTGALIGQRETATNKYHPIQPVPGASNVPTNLTGADVYDALRATGRSAKANEVESIVNGDSPLPTAQSRVPGAQETRALVFQAAGPGFTDALHKNRLETKTSLASSKPNTYGYALRAQGTLFEHENVGLDAADSLMNSPVTVLNKIGNWIGTASSDPRIAAIEVAKTRINQELEKYFTGGAPTVSGLADAKDELNASQGPAAFKAAIGTINKLVAGQQAEYVHSINKGMGYLGTPNELKGDEPLIISPQALAMREKAFARTVANPADNSQLMDRVKRLGGGGQPAPPPNAAVPQGPPGGRLWGKTPEGRPIFMMPDGSQMVPQ